MFARVIVVEPGECYGRISFFAIITGQPVVYRKFGPLQIVLHGPQCQNFQRFGIYCSRGGGEDSIKELSVERDKIHGSESFVINRSNALVPTNTQVIISEQ
jgi:hypothetical protein